MEVDVRDPVHNFITLREKQVKLVGTRALQRLRGIHQLALANLVFPGAVHTRFDHTIGVTHVAGLMAQALGLDGDSVELVQHAALLHDIGHGPFSHVSEHVLDRYADRTKLQEDQKKEKIHEVITGHMIRTDKEIVGILGNDQCNQIAKLLSKGYGRPALRSIVSGPLDADKQDYLLRDSHFCGVEYGRFDIRQMHRSLVLIGPKDEEELMIDRDGIHAVEQFVLAKYFLTTNVYRHKVRLITDQMIVRAIVLGIDRDDNKELRKLYQFTEPESFVENYLAWDDARFMCTFGAAGESSRCGTMLGRLRERRLLKRVFLERPKEFPAEVRDTLTTISRRERDPLRNAIEKAIAEELASRTKATIDQDFVIVHAFDIKSVRETSRNEEEGILVNTSPAPKPFIDESTLFASINEGYVDRFVEVYAPVVWETPADKNRIRRETYEPIKNLIENHCKKEPTGAMK
jgi:HD superfamily phosphohydrolase